MKMNGWARGMAAAGVVLSWMAGARALADLPPVVDRVPEKAVMVVAVRDVEAFTREVEEFTGTLGIPIEPNAAGENPLEAAKMFLSLPGVNKNGSMALIALPGPDGQFVENYGVALVPVTDFDAMVSGVHAAKAGDVWLMDLNDTPVYAKAIDGWAVMGPHKDLVASYAGGAGGAARLGKAMGPVGRRIGDTADVVVIADVSVLRPRIDEAADNLDEPEGLDGLGPAREQVVGMVGALREMVKAIGRDGGMAVAGLSLGSSGVTFDLAAQFREGTEASAMFASSGDSAKIMGRLPRIDYYFAGAMDMTNPGVRAMMARAGEGEGGAMASFARNAPNMTGMGFVMGASAGGIMGGLLANTCTYAATKEPGAFLDVYYGALKAMDGQTQAGMTFKFSHEPAKVEIAGTKVDIWSMAMQPDPNDGDAMQAVMMQGALFGQGGMQGMTAATEGGVVSTLSQNSVLITQAISAAKTGEGLGADAMVRQAGEALPKSRFVELYIGTRTILDTVNQALAMFMGGVEEIELPASVAPIVVAGSAEGGGAGLHVHIPMSSAKAIGAFVKGMREGMDDEMLEPEPDEMAPKS